jgi:acyl-CoA reductase-like NAD-dependent aldehyde dehydrogenase
MSYQEPEQGLADAGVYGHFIGGDFAEPRGNTVIESINPPNGRVPARFAEATEAQVDAAVSAAYDAFHGDWKRTTVREFHHYMIRLARALGARAEERAWLETLDVGKSTAASRATMRDLPYSIDYYAGNMLSLAGQTLSLAEHDVLNVTLREPLGVCGLIVPWNYPVMRALLKIAPALEAGNTVVLKPPVVTQLSAYELARAVEEAGFPQGVVNIVFGPGRAGSYLVNHPKVAKISFTGGSTTGAKIYAAAAQVKRLILELGGESPLTAFDDADIEHTGEVAKIDCTRNADQVCAACTRLIVQDSVADAFIEALGTALANVRVGAPGDEATEMGPLVNAAQLGRVHEYVRIGADEGARMTPHHDLSNRSDLAEGYFYLPSLFVEAKHEIRARRRKFLAQSRPCCVFCRRGGGHMFHQRVELWPHGQRLYQAHQPGPACREIHRGKNGLRELWRQGGRRIVFRWIQAIRRRQRTRYRGDVDDTQVKSVRAFHG